MAGDWIKMRAALATDPKVLRMGEELESNSSFSMWLTGGMCDVTSLSRNALRYCVTGALHAVWCACNEHAKNDVVDGAGLEWIDNVVGYSGFGAAMQKVGWVISENGNLRFPNFCNNNTSAAERQKRYRERKAAERHATRDNGVTSRVTSRVTPREEKSREEKNTENNTCVSAKHDFDSSTPRQRNEYPEDFEVFWSHYPRVRRVNKGDAVKAWKQALRYTTAEVLISSAVEYAASRLGLSDYSKMPATWLRDRSWEDDRESWNRESKNGNGREPKLRGLEGGTRVADSL